MLRLSKDSKVDFEAYKKHLGYLGFIYYDIDYLSERLTLMQQKLDTTRYLLNTYLKECSGNTLHNADGDSVRRFLINFRGVNPNILTVRDKGVTRPSVCKDVLNKVRDMGKAREFIDMYLSYTSLRTKTGLVRSALYKCKDSDAVAQDGSPLYKVTHKFEENGTLRTYYSDFNHQQLDKEDLKALKAPKGYTLVMGDFAQSDFKIAYNMLLRDPSNIDTMFRYPDSYEALARVVEGSNFSLEEFKENRSSYKTCALSSLYGGRSASTLKDREVTLKLKSYYETLKPYVTFKNNIEKRMKLNLPVTVKTFFGTNVMVNTFGKKSNVNILNSYLSAPSQTGTSEVVIMCANAIMDRFAEHGITEENGGIYLAYNKHDELVFYLKNEYLQYAWIFQENEDIIVEGWMPLQIKFSFSDRYNSPNEQIDKAFKSAYKDVKPFDINELIANAENADFFIPCEGVLEIAVGHYIDYPNGRTIIAMLDLATNKVVYNELSTTEPEKIVQSIVLLINRNAANLKKNNITSAIVYSTLTEFDKLFGSEIMVGFKTSYDNSIFMKVNELVSNKFEEIKNESTSKIYKTDVFEEIKGVDRLVSEALDYLLNSNEPVEDLSKYNPNGPTPKEHLLAIFNGQPLPNVGGVDSNSVADAINEINLDFDVDDIFS